MTVLEAQKITPLLPGLLSPKRKLIDKMGDHPYLAPEAARGWPRATAPPHVFSFSRGISRACSVWRGGPHISSFTNDQNVGEKLATIRQRRPIKNGQGQVGNEKKEVDRACIT
jgi:hypothetical protein